MLGNRLFSLFLLTAVAIGQQSRPSAEEKQSGSFGEPSLPVVTENVCPFEGCTFREWSVEKDTTLYSTWQDTRKQVGEVKNGEKVQGLTGVYITRQPDKFLVTEPIPGLSLKTGDVILQYAEYGEGYADVWMKGKWYKDFDWGQEDNDPYRFSEDNLKQIHEGAKEWWVEVRTSSGVTGWALADLNFGNMDRLGDGPEDSPSTSDATTNPPQPHNSEMAARLADIPEPQQPVIIKEGCFEMARVIAQWRIQKAQPYYGYQGNEFYRLGALWAGEQVNVLDAVEAILKPDRLLVTKPIPDLGLQTDDVILRYGRYRKGNTNIWSKGEWHERDGLATVEKDGSGCHNQCDTVVFQSGIVEHWVEIRTSTGTTGWMLSSRSTNEDFVDSGNFTNLCGN